MRPDTITVRGEGGHVFDLTVPAAGTVRREVFDNQVAKGHLVVLDGDYRVSAGHPHAITEPDEGETTSDVPEGTIDAVIDWVHGGSAGANAADGWEDRARDALEAENGRENPRSTLIDRLEAALSDAAVDT